MSKVAAAIVSVGLATASVYAASQNQDYSFMGLGSFLAFFVALCD